MSEDIKEIVEDIEIPSVEEELSIGEQVVAIAQSEWDDNILDLPKGYQVDKEGNLYNKAGEPYNRKEFSSEFSRVHKYIDEGLGKAWSKPLYTNSNGASTKKFFWCGAFAAYCYKDFIKDSIRNKIFPSTYRMWEQWKDSKRNIKPENARPGDIVVVGGPKSKVWGTHIVIVKEVTDEGIQTLEGNGIGMAACGKRKEGVVTRLRPWDTVMFCWRPLKKDMK
jgi:hypothetical protein